MTAAAETRTLCVRVGTTRAVERVSLVVAEGESVVLLGPSGSGKSTLLHAIAGFLPVESGEVLLAGRRVASPEGSVPAEERSVGVVFQHSALWPHLSALDTVAYPIRRAGVDRTAARVRAMELLERLSVAHLADRRPAQLSGGEQQRIGVARALARDALLYLFDEPTAHLDAHLRDAVRRELTSGDLVSRARITATHDASEGLSIADSVVLLRDGRVVQQGTSVDVYERPVDRWSAILTGPVSVLDSRVSVDGGRPVLRIGATDVEVDGAEAGGQVLVRPEWARLGGPFGGVVSEVGYRGGSTDVGITTEVGSIRIRSTGAPSVSVGERVTWDLDRVWVVDDDGTTAG